MTLQYHCAATLFIDMIAAANLLAFRNQPAYQRWLEPPGPGLQKENPYMALTSKLATVLLAAPVLATTIAAAPAAVASPSVSFQEADIHRGTAGCFAWSWGDGDISWTVYWHNQCSSEKTLVIEWFNDLGPIPSSYVVPADGKGHERNWGGYPTKIYQLD